jgi:hypothetical protein
MPAALPTMRKAANGTGISRHSGAGLNTTDVSLIYQAWANEACPALRAGSSGITEATARA